MLFITMKLSLLVYNTVGGGGGGGGKGLPSSDGITCRHCPPCQRIFVPSDPGVPRTFVMDCSSGLNVVLMDK